jgi:O-antigen ligase
VAIPAVFSGIGSDFRRPTAREAVEYAGMLGLLVCWALVLTHATGGREGPALELTLAAAGLAALAVRPWIAVRPRTAALLAAPAVAAGIVCAVTPQGWAGGREVASLALAGVSAWVVLGFARTPLRRQAVLATLCLAGFEQFSQAWLPWWGGEDATRPMLGTFYWHNQYGAFSAAVALLGGGLAVVGTGRIRLLGGLTAAFCLAGTVLSTSRATMALTALGWAGILVAGIRTVGWRPALRRWLTVGVAAVGLAVFFCSPLLMEQPSWPGGATEARSATHSVGTNTGARLVYWQAAARVFGHNPLTGTGFGDFEGVSAPYWQAGFSQSSFAHNAVLQYLADGGLLLGVPVLLLVGAALWYAARAVSDVWRGVAADRVAVPVIAAAGLLVAHALVDFDWSYPALLVLAAVVGALLPGLDRAAPGHAAPGDAPPGPAAVPAAVPAYRWVTPVAAVLLVVAASACAVRAGAVERGLASTPLPRQWAAMPDARLSVAALDRYNAGDHGVPPETARAAVDATERLGRLDPGLGLRRAAALARLGDRRAGLELAGRIWAEQGGRMPQLRSGVAAVHRAAGQDGRARALLLAGLLDPSLRASTRAVFGRQLGAGDAGTWDPVERCAVDYASAIAAARGQEHPAAVEPAAGCLRLLRAARDAG